MDAVIAYAARTDARPRYYANDHSRDRVPLDPQMMRLNNGRISGASLDREGFALIDHVSSADPTDPASADYQHEIATLIRRLTGADHVVITAPGVLRFSERSAQSGVPDNSRPARFAHVDISDATAAAFAEHGAPPETTVTRAAHYNVWRVLSDPPQDVPLALCDARSVSPADLIAADAIFDVTDRPEWSFEGLVVAHDPAHRWYWFPDMNDREALVFKTHDSDGTAPHCVPHVAFDNTACPADAAPRASIEMRAIAYWTTPLA